MKSRTSLARHYLNWYDISISVYIYISISVYIVDVHCNLFRLRRPRASIHDCAAALALKSDSAKVGAIFGLQLWNMSSISSWSWPIIEGQGHYMALLRLFDCSHLLPVFRVDRHSSYEPARMYSSRIGRRQTAGCCWAKAGYETDDIGTNIIAKEGAIAIN